MRRARTCYYCYYYYILYRRTRINPLTLMTGSWCFFHTFFLSILLFIRLLLVSLFIFLTLLLTRPSLYNILYIFILTHTLPGGNNCIYTVPCYTPSASRRSKSHRASAEAPFTAHNTIVPGKS